MSAYCCLWLEVAANRNGCRSGRLGGNQEISLVRGGCSGGSSGRLSGSHEISLLSK